MVLMKKKIKENLGNYWNLFNKEETIHKTRKKSSLTTGGKSSRTCKAIHIN
jgi:hypothetical protein